MKMLKRILPALLLALLLAAPALCEQAAPGYYEAGIETAKLMGEIAGNRDFLMILIGNSETADVGQAVAADDYGEPAAVYSLRIGDKEALLESVMDADDRELYGSLPEALREQLLKRLNVQTFCAMQNSKAGIPQIAFASAATAAVRTELEPEESLQYLYVFEKGTPVLVSFGYHGASGMFVFLDREQSGSADALRKVFPELEITPLEKP